MMAAGDLRSAAVSRPPAPHPDRRASERESEPQSTGVPLLTIPRLDERNVVPNDPTTRPEP
jgi:hypothetical protein